MEILANVAKVGVYKIKAINSLVHGGPYLAVHLGTKRVAWLSFATRKCTPYAPYEGMVSSLKEVEDWFSSDENFNNAASVWNNFQNGVTVKMK